MYYTKRSRPTSADIDLHAYQHNLEQAKALAGAACVLAVIKANAYGHGSVAVGRALSGTADAFGVACVDEALELRNSGISNDIVVMEGPLSFEEVAIAKQHDLILMICDESQIDWLSANTTSGTPRCWLKIDSGMHRMGVEPQRAKDIIKRLVRLSGGRKPEVLCTHLAAADDPEENPRTELQASIFKGSTCRMQLPLSMANSAALLRYPQYVYQWVRPGYMLTGNTPLATDRITKIQLKPAMSLTSAIIALRTVDKGEGVGYGYRWIAERQSRIATVAIGYGDGYPRHLPDGTPVLVNGHTARLAGRVSMDMITIDVTDLPSVNIGDRVELWGKALNVNTIASCAGTIGYELLTSVTARVPRRYENDAC